MKTSPVTPADLEASVLSVPPLARNADLSINLEEYQRPALHLDSGGVITLMYGGNANFYNIGAADFGETLERLIEVAPKLAWVIPSLGPDYGKAMEQAAIAASIDARRPLAAITLPSKTAAEKRPSRRPMVRRFLACLPPTEAKCDSHLAHPFRARIRTRRDY